jgi:nucleotide-binding universal stress UspA family protein
MSPSTDTQRERHAAQGGPFRRVLVAWDGSADSVAALRTAAAIVGDGPGHVVAISAMPGPPHREAEKDQPGERPAGIRRVEDTFELTRAAIAETSPVRINLHTAQSRRAAGSICEYATEHGFDLLVIGRHGDGGLLHHKLGHIADAAAHDCQIPVLLVSADHNTA